MHSLTLLSVLVLVPLAVAFPNGAPNCAVSAPQHGVAPQRGRPPYAISARATASGDYVVTIGSIGARQTFKGFRIVAQTRGG